MKQIKKFLSIVFIFLMMINIVFALEFKEINLIDDKSIVLDSTYKVDLISHNDNKAYTTYKLKNPNDNIQDIYLDDLDVNFIEYEGRVNNWWFEIESDISYINETKTEYIKVDSNELKEELIQIGDGVNVRVKADIEYDKSDPSLWTYSIDNIITYDGEAYPQWLIWNGTSYGIYNCSDLNETRDNLNTNYHLMNDIDCSSFGTFDYIAGDFNSDLNGNGYTISNIVYSDNGLFEKILAGNTISNLRLENISYASTSSGLGGLTKYNLGDIFNVSITGVISGGAIATIGGIAGDNGGLINQSMTNILISTSGSSIGGIAGRNIDAGSIQQSYSLGNVSGSSDVGGIIGYQRAVFGGGTPEAYNNYARGKMTRSASDGGGFIGDFTSGTVAYSYSTGISNDKGFSGDEGETCTNNFYDTNTSGKSDVFCATPKTTTEMKTQGNYTSWDFTDIWVIDGSNNDGYPYFQWQSFPIPPPNIDLLFYNGSDYKSTFDEGENFYIYINLTTNETSSPINNSNCTVFLYEGVVENEGEEQFTLCGSGCDYENYTQNISLNGNVRLNDSLSFYACHEQLIQGDIEINIWCDSGSYNNTLDGDEIVSCDTGTNIYLYETDICVLDENISYSISYGGINNRRKNITHIEFDREFDIYEYEDMIFNFTSNLYESQISFEYYKHGWKDINVSCINTDTTLSIDSNETITIVNQPPTVILTGVRVGNVTQSYSLVYEYYNGDWEFLGDVMDDDLTYFNVNMTYTNGSVLHYSENNDNINISSDKFDKFLDGNGTYLHVDFIIFANDSFGDNATITGYFNITDTVIPSCSFGELSYTSNETAYLNVSCVDESLLSIDVYCGSVNSSLNSYNTLNTTYASVVLPLGILSEDLICNITVTDGHFAVLNTALYYRTISIILPEVVNDIEISISDDLKEILSFIIILIFFVASVFFVAWRKDVASLFILIFIGITLCKLSFQLNMGIGSIMVIVVFYFLMLAVSLSWDEIQNRR